MTQRITHSAPKRRRAKNARGEQGFSLLETLFALAIMSMASLALFQSSSAMLGLSERAVNAGERTLTGTLDRYALSRLVEGMVPGWPEAKETLFRGDARGFSGVSAGGPRAGITAPIAFELSLEMRGEDGFALIYAPSEISESRAEGALPPWVIYSGVIYSETTGDAALAYMGVDQKFYESWPPEARPNRGYFEDDELLPMPNLPEVIALRAADGTTLWTAVISHSKGLPPRVNAKFGI